MQRIYAKKSAIEALGVAMSCVVKEDIKDEARRQSTKMGGQRWPNRRQPSRPREEIQFAVEDSVGEEIWTPAAHAWLQGHMAVLMGTAI